MDIQELLRHKSHLIGERARRSLQHFFKLVKPENEINWHHALLFSYLQRFVEGKIKNLIICMPPQHGKSEICSRVLPAYILGMHPKKRIISASYNANTSSKFNRDVQRIVDSPEYRIAFPDVRLNSKKVATDAEGSWLRNREEFEIVEYGGYYKNAGIGGGITGRSADIAIIDDPIKGAAEAASPTIRQAVEDWYKQDLGTRLNNSSQQVIIMTRWHENDLVGFILKNPEVSKDWTVLSLPAIKEDNRNPEDPRAIGEALWPSFQNLQRLEAQRALGERAFRCLYQQDPKANRDILIYPDFELVSEQFYKDIPRVEAYGLDFGYNDPMALIGAKISGRELFLHELLYKRNLDPHQLVEELQRLGVSKSALIVCDNSRPEIINYLRTHGYNAVPCEKGAGSVLAGIQIVKSYAIRITNTSRNLGLEMTEAEWIVDSNGFATETPKDVNNHALDASRYIGVRLDKMTRSAREATFVDTTIRRR